MSGLRMRGYRRLGPDGPQLEDDHGIGAGSAVPHPSPGHPPPGFNPRPPGVPPATSPAPSEGSINIPNPLAGVAQAITGGAAQFVSGGQVILGAVLIVVGLLLATGQMGKLARTGGRTARLAVLHR